MRYARVERERRFLVSGEPPETETSLRVTDHYLYGHSLRLRRVEGPTRTVFKFTQKYHTPEQPMTDNIVTNMYLNAKTYDLMRQTLFADAERLEKHRSAVFVQGIRWLVDRFVGEHDGLVLAEVNASEAMDFADVIMPDWIGEEVTDDERFLGGPLAHQGVPR